MTRYYAAMRPNHLSILLAATLGVVAFNSAGCNRQSRGNADAGAESRAASPTEGGATSTAGSAGQAKNFGDTSRSGASAGATDTKTSKQGDSPDANRPENQPVAPSGK